MTNNTTKTNLPIINTNSIILKTDGKKYKYSSEKDRDCNLILPMIIAKGITKFSTNSDPNISENEFNEFKKYIYEEFILVNDTYFYNREHTVGITVKEALLSKFDRLFEVYANDNKITPEEYTKMLKIMLDSAWHDYKKLNCEDISNNSNNKPNETKSFWNWF